MSPFQTSFSQKENLTRVLNKKSATTIPQKAGQAFPFNKTLAIGKKGVSHSISFHVLMNHLLPNGTLSLIPDQQTTFSDEVK